MASVGGDVPVVPEFFDELGGAQARPDEEEVGVGVVDVNDDGEAAGWAVHAGSVPGQFGGRFLGASVVDEVLSVGGGGDEGGGGGVVERSG
ncbi:MAG: hypothetical protein ACRDYF_14695 [Acidimicrobiia bacterium]